MSRFAALLAIASVALLMFACHDQTAKLSPAEGPMRQMEPKSRAEDNPNSATGTQQFVARDAGLVAEKTVAESVEPSDLPLAPISNFTMKASAAAGVGEHHLGRAYDGDFLPCSGPKARSVFKETRIQAPVDVHEMQHNLDFVDNSVQLAANASAWGVRGGFDASRSKRFSTYRAYQVEKVVEVDDAVALGDPPPEGVYFLWRIHYGRMYEVVLEGDKKEFTAEAKASYIAWSGDIKAFASKTNLTWSVRGVGLKPTGDGLLKLSDPSEVDKYYTADPAVASAVPIFVEYKVIPGKELPVAESFEWESRPDTMPDDGLGYAGRWKVRLEVTESSCSHIDVGHSASVLWFITETGDQYRLTAHERDDGYVYPREFLGETTASGELVLSATMREYEYGLTLKIHEDVLLGRRTMRRKGLRECEAVCDVIGRPDDG